MLSLAGLWPSTSDVCTYTAGPSSTPRPNGTCSMMLSFTRLPNTLSASQTVTPTAYAGYNGSDAGVAHVPDAKYDAVLAELKSPPAFSVRYSGGDMDRFKDTCPDTDLATFLDGQWVVNYATYAMFNAGFLPISATLETAQPAPAFNSLLQSK